MIDILSRMTSPPSFQISYNYSCHASFPLILFINLGEGDMTCPFQFLFCFHLKPRIQSHFLILKKFHSNLSSPSLFSARLIPVFPILSEFSFTIPALGILGNIYKWPWLCTNTKSQQSRSPGWPWNYMLMLVDVSTSLGNGSVALIGLSRGSLVYKNVNNHQSRGTEMIDSSTEYLNRTPRPQVLS